MSDAQMFTDPIPPTIVPYVDTPVEHVFDSLYAQAIVRDQPTEQVNAMIDKLKATYHQFDQTSISKEQFNLALDQYITNELTDSPGDEDTIIAIKNAITKLRHEATLR